MGYEIIAQCASCLGDGINMYHLAKKGGEVGGSDFWSSSEGIIRAAKEEKPEGTNGAPYIPLVLCCPPCMSNIEH